MHQGTQSVLSYSALVSAAIPRGPVRREERTLPPDLARGAMLLFIALANGVGAALAGQPAPQHAPGYLTRALTLFLFLFVHARAYPVFAVMFGYGLVQLARRQEAAGAAPAAVRAILLRRNLWLVVFGFVHADLLYYGDFLGAYGLVGMFAAAVLLNRPERVQRIVLWLWASSALYVFALAVLVGLRLIHGGNEQAAIPAGDLASLAARDYASSIVHRLAEWPRHTATVLPIITVVWLGMFFARHRLLEDLRFARLLRRICVAGLGVAILGGLLMALASAGMLKADASTVALLSLFHQVSGMFAGPGYVALFGLLAAHLSRRTLTPATRLATGALAALGQRSLSAYLFQSLAWLVLFAPYTLALNRRFSRPLPDAVGMAALVWLVSLGGAYLLDRYSRAGPAETLLRRLAYGNRHRAK
jgi:uncharacterized protein